MATAGQGTLLNAVSQEIFRDSNGCTSFLVRCITGSAVGAEINIPGLHDSGEWFKIPAGTEIIFRLFHLGIRTVNGRGDGGTATVNYGIVSRTTSEG